jgi:DNA repair protein RadC
MSKQVPQRDGHRRRLRERYERAGLAGFAPHEILELLLTLAIPRKDVKPPARALLARYGTLRGVLDAPLHELRTVPGLGEAASIALHVIRDTATLYLREEVEQHESLADPMALSRFWRLRLGGLDHEVFEAAFLDTGFKLVRNGIATLEEGTVDRAAVYPRVVFENALRKGAAGVVVAHNHPSGNVQPSDQDKVVTRSLVLAAATLQVKLLDHLIVSRDEVFSFRAEGLL